MERLSERIGRWLGFGVLVLALVAAPSAARPPDPLPSKSESPNVWGKTVDLVTHGEFKAAAEALAKADAAGPQFEQVRSWLDAYEKQQAERRALDQADFDKYVGYAKARIDREEFRLALSWALAAMDCTQDRGAFLEDQWLLDLVNAALTEADKLRQDNDWRGAWRIYSLLGLLYETEPRYQKLEREAVTHLRFDSVFKEGSPWQEHIEKVRWADAEKAFEYLGVYYVEPVDFKAVAESGLEQLLLLADSKAAQKAVEGLKNEDDRKDFIARVQERLDQVRTAPSLDRRDCVEHFRRVVTKINAQTVRIPEGLIVSEVMRGALDPLDDFTTVIWPVDSNEFDKHTRGDFVGVGISIVKNRDDQIEVVTPLEDTPAYRAGIQAGDLITRADGQSLKGVTVNKAVEIITGPMGTTVTLTIERNGKEITFPLERSTVRIRSVKGLKRDPLDEERWDHWLDRENSIGYVRVTNFQKNTVEDLDNVLSELGAHGMRGLVLDLRGNPGGLLDTAVQLSSRFLKRDETVVSTKGRIKMEDHVFETPGTGPYSDMPLVVLVDERSASASEIVSGAVRDNHRGIVVGERTFGKFSVQNLIPLSHTGAKLKITTAKYYLPNGDSLHRTPTSTKWGVEPDVEVRLAQKERVNIWEMQRDANLLGPAKPKTEETADAKKEEKPEATQPDAAKAEEDKPAEGVADKDAKDKKGEGVVQDEEGNVVEVAEDDTENKKLPPLEQPDENNRPKVDPQRDAALLMLRVTLLGNSRPAVAAAERDVAADTAKP